MSSLSRRLLTTPIELVKIQQQKQQQQRTSAHDVTGRRRRSSGSDGHTLPARAVAQQVYRVGGIRGLYHGLSATILRDVGGYGLYFFGVRSVPSPPPLINTHPEKVRRHAAPLRAFYSRAPRRPSTGTGRTGRHALAPEPTSVGTAPPRGRGSGDHRLVRDVPVRRDQDAHASARRPQRQQHPHRQQCGRRYVMARRTGAVRGGCRQRRARARLLARFRAYDRARRTSQYGRLWYVRRRRMGLLVINSHRAHRTAGAHIAGSGLTFSGEGEGSPGCIYL